MSSRDAFIGTLIDKTAAEIEAIIRGGPGSGHHGHAGRPGEVGGSLPSGFKRPEGMFRPGEVGGDMPMSDDRGENIRRALEWIYGTTENPHDAGFILPDGRMIQMWRRANYSIIHRRAMAAALEQIGERLPPEAYTDLGPSERREYGGRIASENTLRQFMAESKIVRFSLDENFTLSIDIARQPTRKQWDIMEDLFYQTLNKRGKYWLEVAHPYNEYQSWDVRAIQPWTPLDIRDFEEFKKQAAVHVERSADESLIFRGGPGSGHHGHRGRPGEVGGSLPGRSIAAEKIVRKQFNSILKSVPTKWRKGIELDYSREDFRSTHRPDSSKFTIAESDVLGLLMGHDLDNQRVALRGHEVAADRIFETSDEMTAHLSRQVVAHEVAHVLMDRMSSDQKGRLGNLAERFGHYLESSVVNQYRGYFADVEEGDYIRERLAERRLRGEMSAEFLRIYMTDKERFATYPKTLREGIADIFKTDPLVTRGGPGSGHHGHRGRPGEVGGSLPRKALVSSAEENLASDELDVTNLAGAGFVISPTGRVFGRKGNASLFGYHWQLAQLSIKNHRDDVEALLPERSDEFDNYDDMELSGWGLGFIRGYVTTSTNELTLYVMKVPTRSQQRTIKDIYEFNDIVSFHWEQDLDPEPDIDELEYATYNLSGDPRDFNKSFAEYRSYLDELILRFVELVKRGGPGSGHHGHKGRPGEVGGSLPSGAVGRGADISEFLATPKTPLWEPVNHALRAIEKVHGVKVLPMIPVKRSRAKRRRGAYFTLVDRAGRMTPNMINVVLGREGETSALSMTHEIGHFLDHVMLGRDDFFTTDDMIDGNATVPGEKLLVISNNADEALALQNWWKAIQESETFQAMREFKSGYYHVDENGELQKGYKATAKMYDYPLKLIRSWNSPTEFFARSYAQYIATRSGSTRMDNELELQLQARDRGFAPTQWYAEDFGEIADAFDDLFDAMDLKR